MTSVKNLNELLEGERAIVHEIDPYTDMKRRFQDLGLIEGTWVECIGKSPLGDPTAYLIRGAVIALRMEDSGRIKVICTE